MVQHSQAQCGCGSDAGRRAHHAALERSRSVRPYRAPWEKPPAGFRCADSLCGVVRPGVVEVREDLAGSTGRRACFEKAADLGHALDERLRVVQAAAERSSAILGQRTSVLCVLSPSSRS